MTEHASNETITNIDNTNDKQAVMPLLSGTAGAKVIDIRNLGLMAGITLMRDAASGTAYEPSEGIGSPVA